MENSQHAQKIKPGTHIRVLSYNIQVGISSSRFRHYLTHSWKHFLPHRRGEANLNRIAHLIHDYDFVGIQEADAGSFRSGYVNQIEYLAEKGKFPFWHLQTNRSIGNLAKHSNGILSKYRPRDIQGHRLPGLIPGRGAIITRFGSHGNDLVLILLHLALGKRSRMKQLEFVTEIVNQNTNVIVMGDMNCQPHSPEMQLLLENTSLRPPNKDLLTYPSWRPIRKIDHILTTPNVQVNKVHVLKQVFSDHLPIAMEITLPENIRLTG